MITLLGLSGVARSGKDTFADYLTAIARDSGYEVYRTAFADELKRELDPMFRAFGATAFETDTVKKNLIRPILVCYGESKRAITGGRYWIDKIEPDVKRELERSKIVIVTDVRFNTHPGDEVGWIHGLGGNVIHIERTLHDGRVVGPANEKETIQDPLVRRDADFHVRWPTFLPNSLDMARQYVQDVWDKIL